MDVDEQSATGHAREAGDPPAERLAGRVSVVEPEALVRWSLVTYLAKWFQVLPADSQLAALRTLQDEPVDALVLSDDLSPRSVARIEAQARGRNPAVRIVRMVTHIPESSAPPGTFCLEKPFELAKLAALLGAQGEDGSKQNGNSGCSSKTT